MVPDRTRIFLIILDGVGAGYATDASLYGDVGSHTLGHIAEKVGGMELPYLQQCGLGNLVDLQGVPKVENPLASYGRMSPRSAGKDSISGHWEICGVRLEHPFPTYPEGFPQEIVDLVESCAGHKVIGNEVASGTEIMSRLGDQHVSSGSPILYTSADSVLQILAHEEVIPLEELYAMCRKIRQELTFPHNIARVIARPFLGTPGAYYRTPNRLDFALEPTEPTILDRLQEQNIPVYGIGKVDTLFAGRGFDHSIHTKNNMDGMSKIDEHFESVRHGLIFANLIDFDMAWGHRNDWRGFYQGLRDLDAHMMHWIDAMREDDLVIITADHGNDPTTPSTDHSRENVPVLLFRAGHPGKNLGLRDGFSDVAATIADFFQIPWDGPGRTLLREDY